MRTRRKKSEMPFADALEFASKRLRAATKERERAQKTIAALDAEIPSLQITIQALERQLGTSKVGPEEVMSNATRIRVQDVAGDASAKTRTDLTEDELLPEPEGQEILPDAVSTSSD